jgi:DNA-binding NarL/FixJ family response regulator
MEDGRVRVGVVAADPLRSIGLNAILEECVGVKAMPMDLDGAFAAEGLTAVLVDSRSPVEALTELIGRLRRAKPLLKVAVMGVPVDADDVMAIIGAGAKGYLAETAAEEEIKMAMEVILDGSIWAPRKVLARLIEGGGVATPGAAGSIAGAMTKRELEVLHLLMDGRTNRDIAGVMGIDEVTVKAHLGRMLRKTHCTNRVELTLRAMEERSGRRKPATGRA